MSLCASLGLINQNAWAGLDKEQRSIMRMLKAVPVFCLLLPETPWKTSTEGGGEPNHLLQQRDKVSLRQRFNTQVAALVVAMWSEGERNLN